MSELEGWCVFLNTTHKGWILDAMAKESAASIGLRPTISYIPVSRREFLNFNLAKNYLAPRFLKNNLFMHQDTFINFNNRGKISGGNNSVFVTHISENLENYRSLADAEKIFVQNRSMSESLQTLGILKEDISIIYGAVDHEQYFPVTVAQRDVDSYVLIASDCKPRKNPHGVLSVVDAFPDIQFKIHGKGWTPLLQKTRKNLTYIEFDLKNHPELMRNASAFLSLSHLEGGPISLLEALASGTPCVATPTGFAPDLITPSNGVVLKADYTVQDIGEALDRALELKNYVWRQDLLDGTLSWRVLGKHFFESETLS